MKKCCLLFLTIIVCNISFSQTKKVEHRSHSGSNKTFATKGDSNFGLSPNYKEEKKKADSLRKAKEMQDSIAKAQKNDTLVKPKTKKKVKKGKSK